jgi:hypothetical protein
VNLGQIRTNVEDLGYSQLDTQANSAINRVHRRVLGMRRWDFLEAQTTDAVAAGDSTIGLPADCKRVDAIELEDATGATVDFQFRPYQQFRDYAKWDEDRGVPRWWTEHAGSILIYPTASQPFTATIDYVVEVTDMSVDADEPQVPAGYHDVLVYGAAAELAMRERDEFGYQVFANTYGTRLSEMIAEHGVRQRQNARRVRRSRFWKSVRSYG